MKIFLLCLSLFSFASSSLAQPLPDGEVTVFGGWTARLDGPTQRYAHGALGDDIEAEGFIVEQGGKQLKFKLDNNHVFEDRRVRLVNLDDDPEPEAVIIRSHLNEGAAIAVYDLNNGAITLKSQSPNIGRKNRWLNIAGFGDFTGRGKVEIAAVVTPHLAGSLRIYELAGRELVEIARIDGFTNHVNGTRDLDLAEIRDVNQDGTLDVILPRIDGEGLATIGFAGGVAKELASKK